VTTLNRYTIEALLCSLSDASSLFRVIQRLVFVQTLERLEPRLSESPLRSDKSHSENSENVESLIVA
jgi:hypothetical protein